jgi:hypothetical protein
MIAGRDSRLLSEELRELDSFDDPKMRKDQKQVKRLFLLDGCKFHYE